MDEKTGVQTVVLLPADVRRACEREAEDDGRSLSSLLRKIIRDHVRGRNGNTAASGAHP